MPIFINPKEVQFVDINDLTKKPTLTGKEEVQVSKGGKVSLEQVIDLYKELGSSVVVGNTLAPSNVEKFNAFLIDANITGINVNTAVFVSSLENGQEYLNGATKTRKWGITISQGTITNSQLDLSSITTLFTHYRVKSSGVDTDYETYIPSGIESIYLPDQGTNPNSFVTLDWSSLNLVQPYGAVITTKPSSALIALSKITFKELSRLINIKDIDSSNKVSYTLTEARNLIPTWLFRVRGLTITYPIAETEWVTKQFFGKVADWAVDSKWSDITYAHVTDKKIADYRKIVDQQFFDYNIVVDQKFETYTEEVLDPTVVALDEKLTKHINLVSEIANAAKLRTDLDQVDGLITISDKLTLKRDLAVMVATTTDLLANAKLVGLPTYTALETETKLALNNYKVYLEDVAKVNKFSEDTEVTISYYLKYADLLSKLSNSLTKVTTAVSTWPAMNMLIGGHNLFSNSNLEVGNISRESGVHTTGTDVLRTRDFIPVRSNIIASKIYTLSITMPSIRCYGVSKNYLGFVAAGDSTSVTHPTTYNTWSLLSGTTYVKMLFQKNPITTDLPQSYIDSIQIMVEDGNKSSTYSKSDTDLMAYSKAEADAIEVGGRNLALNSKKGWRSTEYNIVQGRLSQDWVVGQTYTITVKGTINSPNAFGLWRGDVGLPRLVAKDNDIHQLTFVCPAASSTHPLDTFGIYNFPSGTATLATIEWIKIEKGNRATDWSPAEADREKALTDGLATKLTRYNTDTATTIWTGTQAQYDALTAAIKNSTTNIFIIHES